MSEMAVITYPPSPPGSMGRPSEVRPSRGCRPRAGPWAAGSANLKR